MVAGRTLHDAIAKKAALGLKSIYATWKRHKKLTPFVLVWPTSDLNFKECLPTESEVVVDLPEDSAAWTPILLKLFEDTDPFAVLLAQQKGGEILLVLESEYGTSSWHIPIRRHGPDRVLGQPSEKADEDCLGLLWRAGKKN
jgi:hypothetical protein